MSRELGEALSAAFDPDVLPTFEDYFVVEGDVLLTERQLAEYTQETAASSEQPPSSELVVATVAGVPQFYPPERRTLTYAFDVASFDRAPSGALATARTAVQTAMRDWESVCLDCGIEFRLADTPGTVEGDVWFIVRYVGFQPFVAAAFFPNDETSRRYLNIASTFFTTRFDRTGIMRHELGHVLGYRHEHIRGVPGCKMEDDNWEPLTPYDPHSVMHYFCGGSGTFDLEITESDRDGHIQIYGG